MINMVTAATRKTPMIRSSVKTTEQQQHVGSALRTMYDVKSSNLPDLDIDDLMNKLNKIER